MSITYEKPPVVSRGKSCRNHKAASYVATVADTSDMSLLAGEADTRLHNKLLDLLGAVSADPAKLVPVAQNASIDGGAFADHADLLCVWCALEFSAEHGNNLFLPAARFLLRREGFWDPRARWFEQGPAWSDGRLAALADAFPPCPDHVRQLAGEAIELHQRIIQASEHLTAARAALEGGIE